ncbi:unnamed protein product [Prorocentrum cordatum]|uniref:Rad60/SUMO-like domain-containing protein n=1 Tax=Prorocentrum cordatum TaxID=2364126 RepID=A0ABN9X816_9DINO|nr:unnamed protein product [Polarella glacialis]
MVVDFKTGMGRPLGKLMAAWCRHCGVPEGEARFELAGRAERLRPSDTLQGLGVGAAGQPVRIDAVPDGADGPADDPTAELAAEQAARREPGGAEQAPALLPPAAIPAEAAVGSPPPGSEPQGRRPPEQASGATGGGPADSGGAASGGGAAPPPTGVGGGGALGAAAAPGPGKVTVQVVATAADGELAQLDFRMRPEATFSKLMVAWCRENQVDVGAAAFFLEESRRELAPEDSPASIGCGLDAGVLRLRAEPRGGPGAEGFAEQAPSPEAPQPGAPDLREAAAGPAVKVEGEKVLVQVVAESEDGQLVVDFTVKRDTPLRKVMEAWCNHNGLDVGAALFRLDDEGGGAGREVRPEDTLASLGCRPEPGAGAVVLRAQPRDEDGPEAAASSGAAAAAAAGGRPPAAEPPAPAAAAEGHGPPLAAAEGRGPPGPEARLAGRWGARQGRKFPVGVLSRQMRAEAATHSHF